MAVSFQAYTATASQTDFIVSDVLFTQTAEITVKVDGVKKASADYSVTADATSGANPYTVVLGVGVASGSEVLIERDTKLTNTDGSNAPSVTFSPGSALLAVDLNKANSQLINSAVESIESSDRFEAAITPRVTAAEAAILQETTDRIAAVAQEVSDRTASVAQEVSDRTSADTTLQTNIDTLDTQLNSTSVAIGQSADVGTLGVSIGNGAGVPSSNKSVAIGNLAAGNAAAPQEDFSVAVGGEAGYSGQNGSCVAIGPSAGRDDQLTGAVAVGSQAGYTTQGGCSVAVGCGAARENQGQNSVAVGNEAGYTGQANRAVAIGSEASKAGQGTESVAIGYKASTPGTNSIGIGANAVTSASSNQIQLGDPSVSFTINAGSEELDTVSARTTAVTAAQAYADSQDAAQNTARDASRASDIAAAQTAQNVSRDFSRAVDIAAATTALRSDINSVQYRSGRIVFGGTALPQNTETQPQVGYPTLSEVAIERPSNTVDGDNLIIDLKIALGRSSAGLSSGFTTEAVEVGLYGMGNNDTSTLISSANASVVTKVVCPLQLYSRSGTTGAGVLSFTFDGIQWVSGATRYLISLNPLDGDLNTLATVDFTGISAAEYGSNTATPITTPLVAYSTPWVTGY